MSQFVTDEKEGGPQILECHSPIMNLLEQYPIIGRLEQDLFAGVLGTRSPPRRNPHLRAVRVRVLFLRSVISIGASRRSRRISLSHQANFG